MGAVNSTLLPKLRLGVSQPKLRYGFLALTTSQVQIFPSVFFSSIVRVHANSFASVKPFSGQMALFAAVLVVACALYVSWVHFEPSRTGYGPPGAGGGSAPDYERITQREGGGVQIPKSWIT